MTGPRRISVVGCSGSGKTYLARQLADQLGAPAYELDQLRRHADGSVLPANDFRDLVDDLTRREAWIIEGHYRDVRHLISQRSDAVIWLNSPLSLVGYRRLRRFNRIRNVEVTPLFPKSANSQPQGRSKPSNAASWRQQFSRLHRTLPERREYGVRLSSPAYDHVAVLEMKSARLTRKWLSSLGDIRDQEAWRAPLDRERPRHAGPVLIMPHLSKARSGEAGTRHCFASSVHVAESLVRFENAEASSQGRAKTSE